MHEGVNKILWEEGTSTSVSQPLIWTYKTHGDLAKMHILFESVWDGAWAFSFLTISEVGSVAVSHTLSNKIYT